MKWQVGELDQRIKFKTKTKSMMVTAAKLLAMLMLLSVGQK
jgi:hypothetical protein